VGVAQREAEQSRREVRAEAVMLVRDARVEADELRRTARRMLDDARTEVASLTTRRDEIAEELGRLSGVIEALSVSSPGRAGGQARPSDNGLTSGVESAQPDVPR
jgi:hypothetical protein